MNWLISKIPLVGKVYSGFEKARDFLSGKKAYIAATILLLQGASQLIDELTGVNNSIQLLDFLKHMGNSDAVRAIATALLGYGLRAGIAKSGSTPSK